MHFYDETNYPNVLAIYKTRWDSVCYDVDLLAAFDDAIRDGVRILSLSLGAQSP